MTLDIIGAGIAGLTTAIALKDKGLKVSVYDQSAVLAPVGAGLILASNAMQVYDRLGLRQLVEAASFPVNAISVRKPDLSLLSLTSLKGVERRSGVGAVGIHRAALQRVLLQRLGHEAVSCGQRLKSITQQNDTVTLSFQKGTGSETVIESKGVIGADGLNSVVRKAVYPQAQNRSAQQICWRGIASFTLPKQWQGELVEIWGRGERFGFVQIGDGQVYWFAVKAYPIGVEGKDQGLGLGDPALFERYFSGYAPLINEILLRTNDTGIYRAEIEDIAPHKKWYQGQICLVGDAAHPTTPNLGQGACQAVEDAYILAEYLAKLETNAAFAAYQKARIRKAHHIINTSWRLGKLAHLSNPILARTRDFMLKATPAWVSQRQMQRISTL